MGITWVFGFVAAFTNKIVLTYFFIVLNSLQGLFLFISCVWTKEVRSEIRGKTKKSVPPAKLPPSSKATKSTLLTGSETSKKSDIELSPVSQ